MVAVIRAGPRRSPGRRVAPADRRGRAGPTASSRRTAVVLLLLGAGSVAASEGNDSSFQAWNMIDHGLHVREFVSPPGGSVGKTKTTVVRVDTVRYGFKLLCCSERGCRPMSAGEWCRRFGLAAAVNAGMFQVDSVRGVGYMKCGEHVNNRYVREDYNAAFAFDPRVPTLPSVKLIDTECDDFLELRLLYGSVFQSIRMISCRGTNVWSKQEARWSMCVVGVDSTGTVLLIFSRAPHTAHDFIEILLDLPLGITRAMYLEGGAPASLYLSTKGVTLERNGIDRARPGTQADTTSPAALPNVLGVVHRDTAGRGP